MRILIVDDELSMREYLELLVAGWGHEVMLAATVPAALACAVSESVIALPSESNDSPQELA